MTSGKTPLVQSVQVYLRHPTAVAQKRRNRLYTTILKGDDQMMICKADFEELFPGIFKTPKKAIARCQDDGGQIEPVAKAGPHRDAARTMQAKAVLDPAGQGLALA